MKLKNPNNHKIESNKIENKKQKTTTTSLAELGSWDIKTTKLFRKYLIKYESLPSYKKILNSMIKFKDMYQPIVKGSTYIDLFSRLAVINEEKRLKRIQVYMNKRDIISTFDEIHGKKLVITSRGRKIFYKDLPLTKLRKEKWNGWWTIIMYDFPETIRTKRVFIRRKLMSFGFGTPQISILASPLPLEKGMQKLIEGENLKKFVWVLKAKSVLGMKNDEVAKKAWPIDEINQLYNQLLKILPKIKKDKILIQEWRTYFLAIDHADPYLPFELLPKNWLGETCAHKFVKLSRFGTLKSLLRKL